MTEVEANVPKHTILKAVYHFRSVFAGKKKETFRRPAVDGIRGHKTFHSKQQDIVKSRWKCLQLVEINVKFLKAVPGCGHKRAFWVSSLNVFWLISCIWHKVQYVLASAESKALGANCGGYCTIQDTIHFQWQTYSPIVDDKMDSTFHGGQPVFLQTKTENLVVSPLKQSFIWEVCVFSSRETEAWIFFWFIGLKRHRNADKTHFTFNVNNGNTLGFIEDNDVKYGYVVSDGEPITMMVCLTGGFNATIMHPILIFKNVSLSYLIRGLEDSVPDVLYRTSPKAWMDTTVFRERLFDPRAIFRLAWNRQRVLYVDNFSLHVVSEAEQSALENIRTPLRKLRANDIKLLQPSNSFVIQKHCECLETKVG